MNIEKRKEKTKKQHLKMLWIKKVSNYLKNGVFGLTPAGAIDYDLSL